jgi:hypothetical protein
MNIICVAKYRRALQNQKKKIGQRTCTNKEFHSYIFSMEAYKIDMKYFKI